MGCKDKIFWSEKKENISFDNNYSAFVGVA